MNIIKNKNINKILSKKYILFNNINLELDNFKGNSFNIYLGKLLYKFDFNDFKNLILTSLFNYDIYNFNNIVIKPKPIRNPYTNIEISQSNLYNFYFFCKTYNYIVPTIFVLYYNENFNIKQLFCNHEIYIVKNSFIKYIKNLSKSERFDYLILMINEYTDFIIKYLHNLSIKYLLYNYKRQFYNISLEKINYYDIFLRDYLLSNYYLENNNIKQYIDVKIKNIIKLLYDTNINLITNNPTNNPNVHDCSAITNIDDVLNLLNEKIYYIIYNESILYNTTILSRYIYETNDFITNDFITNDSVTNDSVTNESVTNDSVTNIRKIAKYITTIVYFTTHIIVGFYIIILITKTY